MAKTKILELLTNGEMMDAIWKMGQKAEAEGKEVDQLMRFTAIAEAQLDKVKNTLSK